jgi:hypothetical protein
MSREGDGFPRDGILKRLITHVSRFGTQIAVSQERPPLREASQRSITMKKISILLGALALSLPAIAQVNVGVGTKTDAGASVGTERGGAGVNIGADVKADVKADTGAQARGAAQAQGESGVQEKKRKHRREGARVGAQSRTQTGTEGSVSR